MSWSLMGIKDSRAKCLLREYTIMTLAKSLKSGPHITVCNTFFCNGISKNLQLNRINSNLRLTFFQLSSSFSLAGEFN